MKLYDLTILCAAKVIKKNEIRKPAGVFFSFPSIFPHLYADYFVSLRPIWKRNKIQRI